MSEETNTIAAEALSHDDEDDITAFFSKYKIPIISLVGIAIFGILFFGWFSNYKETKNEEFSKKIYQFSLSDANSIDRKKFDVGSYVNSVKDLFRDTEGFEGIFPLLLSSADKLFQKGDLKESLELLLLGEENFASSNPYKAFFIRSRLAAVYEDLGSLAKSSEVLKKLLKSPVKLMELKVYLDLGRLYLKQGNQDKAKTTFQYVVDNGRMGDEVTKVAKLYLSDLNFAK